ncbi:MAG TPA: hypothetical protein VF796_12850 [Humisphaera sp.]
MPATQRTPIEPAARRRIEPAGHRHAPVAVPAGNGHVGASDTRQLGAGGNPRAAAARLADLADAPAGGTRDRADPCRRVLRLWTAVQAAGPSLADRKRALLDGLCRLAEADRAEVVVSTFDRVTGEPVTVSVAIGTGPDRAAAAAAVNPDAGPCLHTFLSLDGVRLVARLALTRAPGGRRFTSTERAMVEAIHGECAWAYAEDLANHANGSARRATR